MVAQHIVTLANSIVGVSVLAMPFCFKQCGVVLATLILVLGAVMTRLVCYFLLKSSIITRRRTYELLAFHTFGEGGKLLVELTIIGYLVGTLIAFLVVMGDLGPQILVEIFSIQNNDSLRTVVMTGLALFVVLPLGLLRNIESLSSVSTASVLFYLFLVAKLLSESAGPILSGSFLPVINYWRPAGVLQSIPIFSMALSCQTQVLGIYDILPEPSVQKMSGVIKSAVYICTGFYITVGLIGYIGFCDGSFGGNILVQFDPCWSTQLIKSCFLASIAFSFPIVILPCRASLHSMLWGRGGATHHAVHDIHVDYIPDSRVKLLTLAIVGLTLVFGLLIPNIELVLGLVGSTCGSIICIILPSLMFIKITNKNTTEKLMAQSIFVIGICLMVLTTYVTLYAVEQSPTHVQTETPKFVGGVSLDVGGVERVVMLEGRSKEEPLPPHLPPIPSSTPKQILMLDEKKLEQEKEVDVKPPSVEEEKQLEQKKNEKLIPVEEKGGGVKPQSGEMGGVNVKSAGIEMGGVKAPSGEGVKPPPAEVGGGGAKAPSGEGGDGVKKEFVAEEFLKKLEEQNEEQRKLIEQQKQILAKFEQHHAEDLKREKEKIFPTSSPIQQQPPKPNPQPMPNKEKLQVEEKIEEKRDGGSKIEVKVEQKSEAMGHGSGIDAKVSPEVKPKVEPSSLPQPPPKLKQQNQEKIKIKENMEIKEKVVVKENVEIKENLEINKILEIKENSEIKEKVEIKENDEIPPKPGIPSGDRDM